MMIDNKIIEEITSTYSEHEKIIDILNDIKQDANITFWADKFCSEEFSSNCDLAQPLFEYALHNCEEYRDYKELAFRVGNSNGFDDKEWANKLIMTAITKITNLRDLRVLADDLAQENNSFYDRGISMELYKEAIEKSKSAYDFYCIAESLCNKDLLDDKDWATDIYQKAIEVAADSDELTYIADSIADEDNLDDEKWSEELYLIAEEFAGNKNVEGDEELEDNEEFEGNEESE